MKIKILFRACDKVPAVNGGASVRPLSLDKSKVIEISALSLKKASINTDCEFFVIGDQLKPEMVDFLKDSLNPKEIFNSESSLGSGGSLLKASEIAASLKDDDLIFFCEDDYLFLENSFSSKLNDFYEFAIASVQCPWFIHPTDYPDQYFNNPKRSFIFALKNGYWREVSSTTGTFLCLGNVYKEFSKYFDECFKSDDKDGNLSKIFGDKALCFSPIGGIGTHLHLGTMPMYIDWESEIKKYL